MKKFTMFACLAFALVFALGSFAGDLPNRTNGDAMVYGGSVNFEKAGGDTINLMSSADDPTNNYNPLPCSLPEPHYVADFEGGVEGGRLEDAIPGNGWSSYDITQPTVTHWEVSNYNQAVPTNLAAWCGDIGFDSCDPGVDPVGGYGNAWHDLIEFSYVVLDANANTTVTVAASMIHDSEGGYDYTRLSYLYNNENFTNLESWDGQNTNFPLPNAIGGTVSYLPTQYVDGAVKIFFRFQSDGAWSDEDCLYGTAGACQIDDISVTVATTGFTAEVFTEDFQGVDPLTETSFPWKIAFPNGVGDYARYYSFLGEIDPCTDNFTTQIAFIDDGIAVPGTGGSDCADWCYGPGGYTVTTTGGLAGPDEHIYNAVESPVMTWPSPGNCSSDVYDGAQMLFDVYRHEALDDTSPGIFYTWGVRSANLDSLQVIADEPWRDRNFVYYGGPNFTNFGGGNVTDLLEPDRHQVQIQLTCYELGWAWGYVGDNGTPAPYFDNVRFKVFPFNGSAQAAREIDLAQDNWPTYGSIDMAQDMSIRFDMANNISAATHLRNDPGDSIIVDIVPVRLGAAFSWAPRLNYKLLPNPIFNALGRTLSPGPNGFIEGFVDAKPAVGLSGSVTPKKYAFDLPDTGFLYPGDVLHYYISATDDIGGSLQQTSTLPADTTGFSTGFADPVGYNSTFTVRGLPGISTADGLTQPGILFLNDFANRGGEDEWYTALKNIGLDYMVDYDVYYTNGPSSGVGNGIGGRANDILLTNYNDILYTAGNLGAYTITNGDFRVDAGNDIQAITLWLDQGGKDIFLTGDDLAFDLARSGAQTLQFLETYMGVTHNAQDLAPLIGAQTTPEVFADPYPGNQVFQKVDKWIAFGGCPGINTFDAVTIRTGSTRLAVFGGGTFDYSAATLNSHQGSRMVSMPYDLMFIHTHPTSAPDIISARTKALWDVLIFFGVPGDEDNASPAPLPGIAFKTSNYPNPFNPSTTIKYSMPKAGHLELSVYNVRGQLVKTLINGTRPAGADQTVVWDGTNNQGSSVSSGVYFYEARTGGEVKVQKMALVK